MATRIDMPQLGLTMEMGTVLQWLKQEGEKVEKGQPVVLIQTDKVEYEVESPATGTLLKAVAAAGAELPIGSLMGVIGEPGEDVAALLGAKEEPRALPARQAGRAESRVRRKAPSAISHQPSAHRRRSGSRGSA
jgi:pyruvate dehydrogenase E2 component (dihydrolipoamide acetyltransferase)